MDSHWFFVNDSGATEIYTYRHTLALNDALPISLMSWVREPDLYRCAVGYVDVDDLDVQRQDSDTAQSEYGRSYLNLVYPEAVSERHAQSPVYGVDRIKAAIMLVHGAKDERVPIKHMHELVEDRQSVV